MYRFTHWRPAGERGMGELVKNAAPAYYNLRMHLKLYSKLGNSPPPRKKINLFT